MSGAPAIAAALALLAALLVARAQAPREGPGAWLAALPPALALAPLAWLLAHAGALTPVRAALAAALALAMLARDPRALAQTECALKLTWVLAAAFALSWAGDSLLSLAAGTARPHEQWPALALALDPYALWGAALVLSLLAGLVLLGGAPFHFWPADLLHGAGAPLAPLILATLQVSGAAWLLARLDGIAADPPAAALARSTLTLAAVVALIGGAATLPLQRRPERRVGTLASLQGALVLAWLAATHADPRSLLAGAGAPLGVWAAHLVLATTGAGTLARFLAVGAAPGDTPVVLFRRHPWTAGAAGYALLSLAGAPGTPGGLLWLATARQLAATNHAGLLLALAWAWLAAFAVAAAELRRAFGSPAATPQPEQSVPWPARTALWLATAGLAAMLAVALRAA